MKTEPNVEVYTTKAKERICHCLSKVREGCLAHFGGWKEANLAIQRLNAIEGPILSSFPALMHPSQWGICRIQAVRGQLWRTPQGKGTYVPLPRGYIMAVLQLESWLGLGPKSGKLCTL